MDRAINIEIIGPPGCGKTTLAKELVSSLSSKNISVNFNKKVNRLKINDIFSARTLVYFPFIFYTFVYVLYLNYRKNKLNHSYWNQTIKSWLRVILIKFQYFKKDDNVINIFEPGFLMLILSGYMYSDKSISNETLAKIIKKISNIEVLISIKIEATLSLERIRHRARGEPIRMKNDSPESQLRIIRSGNAFSKEICSICEKLGVLIIRVNGSFPIHDLAQEVCEKLEKLYEKDSCLNDKFIYN